jgi:thioredoxin-related protein
MGPNYRLTAILAFVLPILLTSTAARAKIPEGWPFVEFNQAVEISKRLGKPMFVYFGFETCPYCKYLNEHTFTSEALRKRYIANYVLAYFDIRGDPNDVITLPGGEQLTRAETIQRLKGNPVPAWMFVDPQGNTILTGRGSQAKVDAFMTYDLYVNGGAYKRMTFDEFLSRRGLRVD